jgi:NitT/TauT family transport system permease protein
MTARTPFSPARVLAPTISLGLAWAIWELCCRAGWLNSLIFPPPSEFVPYLIDEGFAVGLGQERVSILDAFLSSFLRVAAGLAIGFVVALGLGSVLALSRFLSQMFLPLVQLLAPIAPIAWVPLALAVIGIGNASAVFVVFMGVVFILTIAARSAVENVRPEYLKVAKTLGASRSQLWRYVILPAIIPQVFTLLRVNFFAAWMAVLAAEMVGLRSGLGAVIMVGRESANAKLILVGMAMIGFAGYLIDTGLLLIQQKLFWWSGTTHE